MRARRRLARVLSMLGLCSLLSLVTLPLPGARAQSGAALVWSEPVNLSRSGAASHPTLTADATGGWRAYWQDGFDGVTTSLSEQGTWGPPLPVPLRFETPEGEDETVVTRPQLYPGASGVIHALWRDDPEFDQGPTSLRHSRGTLGTAVAWQAPQTLADSALIWDMRLDSRGLLHLVYVRPHDSEQAPAGIYYRQSADGGVTWTNAILIYESLYLRLGSPEGSSLQLAVDANGHLHVVWDEPPTRKSYYSRSLDNGGSWPAVETLPRTGASRPYVIPTGVGEALLRLWQGSESAQSCVVEYQYSQDGGATWNAPGRALDRIQPCRGGQKVLQGDVNALVFVSGVGDERLVLTLWNGERWSESLEVVPRVEPVGEGEPTPLRALDAALSSGRLAIVGLDAGNDLWFQESVFDTAAWAFASPPAWSPPLPVTEQGSIVGVPALAMDRAGGAHLLWSLEAEGSEATLQYAGRRGGAWTSPAELNERAGGDASDPNPRQSDEPSLVVAGDQLHAVWTEAQSGAIWYRRAPLARAEVSDSWSAPTRISSPAACCPSIKSDALGRLHVAYAISINEQRGLYYTRSEDGGGRWSEPTRVFDAASAGWPMVTDAALALDPQGGIHMAWVRGDGSATRYQPMALYYGYSADGGDSWTEAVRLGERAPAWPLIAVDSAQRVHLLWNEATGRREWWHRWLDPSTGEWSFAAAIPDFAAVQPPAMTLSGDGGTLYVLGADSESPETSTLRMAAWDGAAWTIEPSYPLDQSVESGIAAALDPGSGELMVAYRGAVILTEEGVGETGIWTTSRTVAPFALPATPTSNRARATASIAPEVAPTAAAAATAARLDEAARTAAPPRSGALDGLLPFILGVALTMLLLTAVFLVRGLRR